MHYIKVVPQLEICPVREVPQNSLPVPTLSILTLPFLLMFSRSHIFHIVKLLLKLFFSELRRLVTGFSFSIEIFAFSPRMVAGKKTAPPGPTYLVPYSFRARILVTTHTCLRTRREPPRQSVQRWEIMDTPYYRSTEIELIRTQGIIGTDTLPEF